MSRIPTIALLALIGLPLALPAEAQELQGAASALQQMTAQKPPPTRAAPKAPTPTEVLRRDLAAFRDRAPALPPRDAARSWLALMQRYATHVKAASAANRSEESEPLAFQQVLEALPPPSAWNALTAEILARQPVAAKRTVRDLSLLLLTHVLQDDQAGQWRDVDALQALLTRAGENERAELAQTIIGLSDALTKQSGNPKRILQGIELHLAIQQIGSDSMSRDGQNMQIPDLVTLLGPQKAEILLRRVLVTSNGMVEIPVGDATRRLAQKLALELAAKVKVPQWKLAESQDSLELYEALAKRFVKTAKSGTTENIARAVSRERGDSGEKTARVYYFLGLIVKGRTQKAAQIASSFGTDQEANALLQEALKALDRSGHTRALSDFLHTQLTQNPNLPLWDIYIESAPRAGQAEPMLTLVRATAARKDLSNERRASLQTHLYQALLAADHVDEAVPIMRRILAAPNADEGSDSSERTQTALQLVRLGYYLKQDAWSKEGMAILDAALQTGDSNQTQYVSGEYANLLMQMGRYAEAEKTRIAALVRAVQDSNGRRLGEEYRLAMGQAELIGLAQLYYQAGRYADVMTLLDKAPNWMAKDVSDLDATSGMGGQSGLPIEYIAAVALAETGKRAEAAATLEALLLKNGGFDPGYERLLALRGQEILPFLDTLFRRNRFEERPLIWKATVLQRAGRLEEAEKTIREAIAIDPSDGEEGHGDRMRAYSVLADIREARGDQAQAKLYREAVRSIRISEHADDLLQAGLVTRAITLYQEALTHFADAYCIQSRLAIQMMESGNLKEAEEHYRRAFELMPDSFGRMESHCFGCEGAFRGEVAESTAEKVFQELLKKTPNKPQVHYLAGYLRDEQQRYGEALTYYREAVTLDPDYINAWRRILALGEHIALPQTIRNSAGLNQMRLQNDVSALSEVTDLRAAWAAVQTARTASPPRKRVSLYPLAASKAAIEKAEAEDQTKTWNERIFSRGWRMRSQGYGRGLSAEGDDVEADDYIPLPGQVVARQRIVTLLSTMLDSQFQRAE